MTNVAVHHLMHSANFDLRRYHQGIADAGWWEGVHTTLGRVISFGFSAASFGTSQAIQSTAVAALHATGQGIKVIAHAAPSAVINPFVTGRYRINTDVTESLRRKGGAASLAENIENSSPMVGVRKNLIEKQQALIQANNQLQTYLKEKKDEPVPVNKEEPAVAADLLKETKRAFYELFAAQKEFKTSTSAGKEKTWSKGWGMAVNAVGAAGVAAAIPAPIAALAIQGACIPLQWLAGRADEKTKHAYRC